MTDVDRAILAFSDAVAIHNYDLAEWWADLIFRYVQEKDADVRG